MRAIIAGIAGVFAAIFGVIGFLVFGGGERAELKESAPTPEVVAERQAPATRANPMTPVTTSEAARRTTLHERVAQPQTELSDAVMAPSVVTEIRSGSADDELSVAIFGDVFPDTPEPAAAKEPLPQDDEPQADKEPGVISKVTDNFMAFVQNLPEPEPETEETAQAEPEEQAPDLSKFRDRFRVDVGKPRSSFGVRNFEPSKRGLSQVEGSIKLDDNALRFLIGDNGMERVAGLGKADGWFEPFRVAGGFGDEGLTDPIVRPSYNYGGVQQGGVQQGYGAPLPHERSAARPAMTNVDSNGNAYTTSQQPNPHLAARNGPIVLARNSDLLMARLVYGFNSDDVRGLPIYAVISDYLPNGSVGPLEGAQIQGQVAYSKSNAAIIFDNLIMPNGREFDMSAIAVSLGSDGRPGVAANVNNHTLARYGSLFLSGIVQGIGEVAQIRLKDNESDQPVVIINEGSGDVNYKRSRSNEPSDGEILAGALAPVGKSMSGAARQGFNRPPTITAPAGMPFGVVFTSTVVSDPAQAKTAFNPRTGQLEVVSAPVSDEQPDVAIPSAGRPGGVGNPSAGETFAPASEGSSEDIWRSLGADLQD